MLTIKAPIELKTTGFVLSSQESFCRRLTGNYEMLTSRIEGEDLLHLVSTPPEIFIAEGGHTNLFGQNNMYQSQENKVEIINNLVNRIMISEEGTLTYQDRVYITNILRKLGITDDRQFMTQVSKTMQEINSRNQLIDIYWEHAQQLSQLVEEYQSFQEDHSSQESNSFTEHELYLHEDILNRLQTGAIYQLVQNFSVKRPGSVQISNNELLLAEQARTANTILLQKLQNMVRKEETPLIYRHDNYFEENSIEGEMVTREQVTKQMVSAILLNILDNLYESRYENIAAGEENWYHMEYGLYKTAENTLNRIQNQITQEAAPIHTRHSHLTLEEQSRFFQQETALLSQIFMEQDQEEYRTFEQPLYQELYERTQNLYRTDVSEGRELVMRTEEEGEIQDEHTYSVSEERRRLIERQLEQLSRHSRESREEYIRLLQMTREGTESARQQDSFGQKQPAETVYENWNIDFTIPETESREQAVREPGQTYEQNLVHERSVEEVRQVTEENLSSIEQELNRINRRNEENYNRIQELRRLEEQQQIRLTPAERMERMKREGIKALSDPQQLLLSYREEAARQEEAQKEARERIEQQALPPESRQIFKVLEQYMQQSSAGQQSIDVTTGNIGRLQKDIEQVNLTVVEQQKLQEEREKVVTEIAREAGGAGREGQAATVSSREYRRENQENLSFVHRETSNIAEEEMVQQLLESNRLLQQKNIVTQQTTETNQVVNTHQNWQRIQNIEQQNQDVTNLIRQDVQKQIGAISDQVYAKLEKRLQNEKKRRGY